MRVSWLLVLPVLALAGCGSTPSSAGSTTTPPAGASNNLALTAAQNHVHSIVILPQNPNALYLGSHYRLAESTDGGHHWRTLTHQMMLSMARAGYPAGSPPATLYAVSLQRGLVKSTDGGTTWSSITHGFSKGAVSGIAAAPTGNTLLTYGNGIYRSTNGGASWTKVLSGHSVSTAAFGVGGSVYAASSDGLFRSRDGGIHWHVDRAIGAQPIVTVAAVGQTAYVATAFGLMRSRNSGATWMALNKAPAGIEFIGVAPSDPNELFAEVGGKGFYATYDGGATWHRSSNGIHDTDFNASVVRVAPSNPRVVYTGAWGLHFYASHDAGRHWTEVANLVH